tara:strand:+ start:4503 stop:5336 length:834 start_codon:yes stop_codon:yes gene_type:complete
MSNYAIGDLQGCYKELQDLLSKFSFNKKNDTLWLCGDLVNRGPESLNCLEFLYSIKDSCRIVLGNHDLHLIAVNESVRKTSHNDTFEDILNSPNKEILINWLKSLPFHSIKKINTKDGQKEFLMTHAGVPPHWSKQQLIKNSEELSQNLITQDSNTFLENIFGNKPDHPDKCKTTEDKLRLNVNYFTRMRFCNLDGSLNLKYKGKVESAPKELKPWFDYSLNVLEENIHLLFGHWAALNGVTGQEKITALDTGCAWGNKLTAIRLEDNSTFSCDKLD